MPEIPQADVWLTERLGDVEAEASDLVVLIGAWYQHVGKVHVDLPYGDDDRTVWGHPWLPVLVPQSMRLTRSSWASPRATIACG